MAPMFFNNRIDAGRELAAKLLEYSNLPDHLVVGLARGGVIVAGEVASELHLPLEFISVRKIGSPSNPEFAMGALVNDVVFINDMTGASNEEIASIIAKEKKESLRREYLYGAGHKTYSFQDQTILLVDDGIATGASLHTSIKFLKQKKVRSIIVAVPVAPPEAVKRFEREVDRIICLSTPADFYAVGQYYADFTPVTDEDVCNTLKSH